MVGEPTPFAERVLDLVDAIPAGRVSTYGDLADMLGEGGPRGVGSVLARWGGGVPWWRVIRSDGRPPEHKLGEALARLCAESVPLDGDRVVLSRARWLGEVSTDLVGGV